jgi:hypothetical protein
LDFNRLIGFKKFFGVYWKMSFEWSFAFTWIFNSVEV